MNPEPVPVFDADLLARYGAGIPHCAAGPPTSRFHAGFDAAELRSCAAASNEEPIPRPLALNVHVPFCPAPCPDCGGNHPGSVHPGQGEQFLRNLVREIEMLAPLFDPDREVPRLHFSSGTPALLEAEMLEELFASLRCHFNLARDATREFGIEVDPCNVDAAFVRVMGELGCNRLSICIHDSAVSTAGARIHVVSRARELIPAARASGFRTIALALARDPSRPDVARFGETLDALIGLAPDRLAIHPCREAATRQAIPLALLARGLARLADAGFVHLGMTQFAAAHDELAQAQRDGTLQHDFRGYSTHANCDLIGLGSSAISRIGPCYSQNASLPRYYAALDQGCLPVARGIRLDEADLLRREVVNTLMCRGRLDMPAFAASHDIDFTRRFAGSLRRLQALAADGLVEIGPAEIRLTDSGRVLWQHVGTCFETGLDEPVPLRRSSTL